MLNTRQLMSATIVGTVLQVAMVLAGHTDHAITNLFAVGGMGFSLVAGAIYGRMARDSGKGAASLGGVVAGALCAFVGILVSYLLGDVPASLLLLGTLSSAVTGALGGALGAIGGRRAASVASAIAIVAASMSRSAPLARARTLADGSRPRPTGAGSAPLPAPVPARLADFAWLVGSWRGQMAGSPAVAEVTYMPPSARVMPGMMRLVYKDTVLVIELISMVETPSGVDVRFRHFDPALTASETEFKQLMRLTQHELDRDMFENTVPYDKTLVSTEPRTAEYIRHGPDEYVAHSDIMGDDGKPAVIEVTYRRVK